MVILLRMVISDVGHVAQFSVAFEFSRRATVIGGGETDTLCIPCPA